MFDMPELANVPFVLFGNKVDKPGSLNEEELRDVLDLPYHKTHGKTADQKNPGARPIELFMCSVTKRAGY